MTDTTIKRLTWASRILALLGLLGGIVAAAKWLPASVQQYSALSTALLLAASRWCEQQLPASRGAGVPKAIVGMLLVGLLAPVSCRGPYDAAWRTMDGVIMARDTTAASLETWGKAELKRCTAKPVAERAACLKPAHDALADWRNIARPAVNSALHLTAASVQIAERAKGDTKINWMALLRPAACALMRVAKQWGTYYPDAGKAVLGYLEPLEGVICE